MPRRANLPDLFEPPPGARVAGIDEAGRGPLAGPVVAAAVIIATERVPKGVRDSKLLSEKAREALFTEIHAAALAVGVGRASVEEIDRLNIHNATLLAMRRAYLALEVSPDFAFVDGCHLPRLECQARAIVDGDALIPAISAASIIAKVTRDRLMRALDAAFPAYGFARNKGYGTLEHREGLIRLGPSPHHRASFAPVRAALERVRAARAR
jgi:ribonuclease HII